MGYADSTVDRNDDPILSGPRDLRRRHDARMVLRPVYRNGELLVLQQWEDDIPRTAAANA